MKVRQEAASEGIEYAAKAGMKKLSDIGRQAAGH